MSRFQKLPPVCNVRKYLQRSLRFMACSIAMALISNAQAEIVLTNLDFNQAFSGITQSGAGAVGTAGDTWNGSASFGGFVGTETPSGNTGGTSPFGAFELLGPTGVASGISYQMTFVNDGIGFSGVFANFPAVAGSPISDLMGEYLFVGGADAGDSFNFTLSGLATNTDYAVYLYGNGDAIGQGATWTLNGASQTSAFDGTSTIDLGGEYARFEFNTGASTTQAFSAGALGASFAVNGFQLTATATAIPEPSSFALVGIVGLAGLVRRRRRRWGTIGKAVA